VGASLGVAVPAALLIGYLSGSVPFAWIIVKLVTGEDLTRHGSGNVGSMNVRRTTGSWGWFVVAMICDALKGFAPVALVKLAYGLPAITPYGVSIAGSSMLATLAVPAVLLGCVLGHNYSLYMMIIERRLFRTGKGLAVAGGAMLSYDWRYFAVVAVVGLTFIAVTRYMLAGQVAAAVTLPLAALALHSPDWPFALLIGTLVYVAHHRRFMGLLRGEEPKLYIDDGKGPRG